MDLKLNNIPTVFYDCFLLHNFMNIRAHEDEDLVMLQTEVAKRNNEGIDNVRNLVYYCLLLILKVK